MSRFSAGARPIAVGLAIVLLLAACGQTNLPFVATPAPTPEQPRDLTVSAVARGSGEPIPGAALQVGGARMATGADGTVHLSALRGARIDATASGFDAAEGTVPATGDLRMEMRSNVLRGVVTGADGKPVEGARIFVDGEATVARSDARGAYELAGVPDKGDRGLQDARLSAGRDPDRRPDDQGRCARAVRGACALRPRVGLRGAGTARRDARSHRPNRGQRDGDRRQGDRRQPVLGHRPADRAPGWIGHGASALRARQAPARAQGAWHLHHRAHGRR